MPKTKEPAGQRYRRTTGDVKYNPIFPGPEGTVRREDNQKTRAKRGDKYIKDAVRKDYDDSYGEGSYDRATGESKKRKRLPRSQREPRNMREAIDKGISEASEEAAEGEE